MYLPTKLPVALGSVLVLAVSSFIWKLAIHRRRFQHLPKPPHSFLFGHLTIFFKVTRECPGRPPLAVVLSIIQSQYDLPDLFYLDLWPLALEPFIVTGDRAIANRFLNDYSRHPVVLKTVLHPLVGGKRGLVSPDISEWHDSRTTIRTVFSVANVARFVPDMAQYSMQLRESLLQRATTSQRFPLMEPIEEWGADLIFRFLLGEDTAVQRGGWGKEASTHVKKLVSQADNQASLNPWTNRQRKKTRRHYRERIRQMIRTAFSEALHEDRPAANNHVISLLETLVTKYKEEYPGRTRWDPDTLDQHVDTVMTMFLAADVSSMVLTYVLCHIAKYPSVAAELRKEHNAVFPGDAHATLEAIHQNPSMIKELPYTAAVIKESMRLRPPGLSATTAPKGHTVDYNGSEHSIGGALLFSNLLRLQSNSAYMSSPLTFDPTRWLPRPPTDLADAWRPFQRGQHSCMGENIVMPGLVTALLLTVRDVDIALAYDHDDVSLSLELGGIAYMDGAFTAKPAKGLPVTIKSLVCAQR